MSKEYQRSTTGKQRAVQNKKMKLRMRAKTSKRQRAAEGNTKEDQALPKSNSMPYG